MARVTYVKKARKDQRPCQKCHTEIKAGDAYKWFANRIGRSSQRKNFCSSCQIRPSDKTTSGNLQTLYSAIENAEDALEGNLALADMATILTDAAEGVREVSSMYEESADNMEEGFGHSTYMSDEIREKASECESFADDLESAASDVEYMDDPDEDDDALWEASDDHEDEPDAEDFEDEQEFANEHEAWVEKREQAIDTTRDERRQAAIDAAQDALANCPF